MVDKWLLCNSGDDIAKYFLQYMYTRLDPAMVWKTRYNNWEDYGTLSQYDQFEFVDPEAQETGFSAYGGYYYVPHACQDKSCKVNVFLHGCLMSAENDGDYFVRNWGFLEHAAANDIIMVFPQTNTFKTRKKYNFNDKFPAECWSHNEKQILDKDFNNKKRNSSLSIQESH